MLHSPSPTPVSCVVKDRRYAVVKSLLEIGHFRKFSEIFALLPKSIVARDLGMNNIRFTKLMNRPDLFLVQDIAWMAGRMEVELDVLMNLIVGEIKARSPNPFLNDRPSSSKRKAMTEE